MPEVSRLTEFDEELPESAILEWGKSNDTSEIVIIV